MRSFLIILLVIICVHSRAQQIEYVDFNHAKAELKIEPKDKCVSGQIRYTFEILQPTDSLFIDAKQMNISSVTLNEESVAFTYDSNRIYILHSFAPSKYNILTIAYETQPKKAMYFVGWDHNARNQVWTQGQGKDTSHWLPSIDDMNEKIEFDLMISAPTGYEVISNGKLTRKLSLDSEYSNWFYDMRQPMSSYLLAIAIGKYDKKTAYSESGIPLEMYYYPQDSLKFEPTYRYTKGIFDFFEREIGIPYPWQNYKQIPVHDFLYAGMENTGATIFSDSYVIDSIGFTDNNYVNINAHELAHQWFGDMVTEVSGDHHWLQEGFATYYALLAERHLFGNDYFYWKLFESAQQLNSQDLNGQSTALLDPKSSSLTFYQKGAWTLYMLREKVGDLAFRSAVRNYLEKYAFKNVRTDDFIREVEITSEQDLSGFAEVWLRQVEFPFDRAMDALKHNSTFIQEYLMVDCEIESSKCNDYLVSGISDEAKVKLIAQNPQKITLEVFKSSTKVRQAIAMYLKEIPRSLKTDYESLLNDNSYITVENALFNLWNNFPEERVKYLSQTKGIDGLPNKNLRLLWLLLSNITPEFKTNGTEDFKSDLIYYTTAQFNFEIRMTAFQYLDMIRSCDEQCISNLEEATTHHNWQLVKFAKQMLEKSNN